MEIKSHLQELIYKAVCEIAGVCVPAHLIPIEHPELEGHGDYSTNIALVMYKDVKSKFETPLDLAKKIVAQIKVGEELEKIEVAGAGFINFTLSPKYLTNVLAEISKHSEGFGASEEGQGKTVVVEYSSPNIAKPFGIGHFSSTIIGQALYNLYKFLGYKVIGDNHLGDWGTQFGKLMYMIDRAKTDDYSIENLEKLYVEFHKLTEADPTLEDEGRKWFKKLEDKDPAARAIWEKCVELSMAEFQRIYDLLDVKIDNAHGESFYEDLMPQVIAEAKQKGITHQSEGAWIIDIPGEKTPLMLVKSDGTTTYATRDLATVKYRKENWQPDLVIYEVGAEQTLHFRQIFAAAQMMGYVTDIHSLVHTRHGLYLDTDGKKFSTRKGKTIKLEEVLNEAIERASKLGSADKASAKAVGIGAIKYFNLMHSVQSDVVFDWEKIMTLEGNSGPYLQYTFARTQSVIKKSAGDKGAQGEYQPNPEEIAILRWIYRFEEIVAESAHRYSPNILSQFLYELAQRFNTFYNKHNILQADSESAKDFRLNLTSAVGQVLKNGLNLLGIKAPESM